MNARSRLLVLVGLAAVAACGPANGGSNSNAGGTPTGSGPTKPVAWMEAAAPNIAAPFTIPGIPPCRAADLAVDVHAEPSYVGGGPRNTSFWSIAVANKSDRPCYLGSTVDVTFATGSGPLRISPMRVHGDVLYLAPESQGVTARLAHRAIGEIDTFPCTVPAITEMQISPSAGLGSVSVKPGPAGGFGAPCLNASMTYLAELSPDFLYPDSCCMGYAAATQTAIEAPAVAHPGQRIRFTITITNWPVPHSQVGGTEPSPTPMSFQRCPTYHEELEGVAETFHTYRLNCSQATPIQPRGTETFEMDIDVPKGAPAGPAVLVWSLDGSQMTYQTAKINLEIVP